MIRCTREKIRFGSLVYEFSSHKYIFTPPIKLYTPGISGFQPQVFLNIKMIIMSTACEQGSL